MFNFWFELKVGILIILVLVGIIIKYNRNTKEILNDEKIIKIVEEDLEYQGIYNFELESIVPLEKTNTTYVIANTGNLEIAFEINNETGKILHKERLARQ